MTADLETAEAPPPALHVRYNPKIQLFRFSDPGSRSTVPVHSLCRGRPGTRCLAICGILIAAAVLWAFWTLRRVRDHTPQVIVDENGVYVREWMVGTVPWENIEYIAHSSSIRRGLVASVTRTRRKPYLLFRFVETPKIKPNAPPPFGWVQYISAEFAIQEPVIQQYGLDTPVNDILKQIQAHIEYWRLHTDTPLNE